MMREGFKMSQQIVCPRGASLYIWKQGDTLSSVALRNRITVQSIYLVNEGRDLSNLRPGDSICLPPGVYACLNGQTYTVRSGDTFAGIARRYGLSTWELLERNPYVDPGSLMVGQVLCVPEEEDDDDENENSGNSNPGGGCTGGCCGAGFRQLSVNYGERYVDILINANVSDAAFRSANPNLDPRNLIPGQRYCAPPAGSRQPVCTGRRYTVRDGENLAMLAQRFNVTEFELIARNPNLTPNDFAPGQVICV